MLETRGLVIGYARPLLRIPDLTLTRGERVAVIGPNGVGKTTLLKTLLKQLQPLAGEYAGAQQCNWATSRKRMKTSCPTTP